MTIIVATVAETAMTHAAGAAETTILAVIEMIAILADVVKTEILAVAAIMMTLVFVGAAAK